MFNPETRCNRLNESTFCDIFVAREYPYYMICFAFSTEICILYFSFLHYNFGTQNLEQKLLFFFLMDNTATVHSWNKNVYHLVSNLTRFFFLTFFVYFIGFWIFFVDFGRNFFNDLCLENQKVLKFVCPSNCLFCFNWRECSEKKRFFQFVFIELTFLFFSQFITGK